MNPQYAHEPLSAEGARIHGGRFNEVGVSAFYLASTWEGAMRETNQGLVFLPVTICSYEVDCDGLVDLRDEDGRAAQGVALEDLACAWELIETNGGYPPSWAVAARFRSYHAPGILVPSFANGALPTDFNIVLWQFSERRPFSVKPIDPAGRLPQPPT